MRILSYNPGHDGSIAWLRDGRLIFSVESEKDSNYRYAHLSIADVLTAVEELDALPDVISVGGWWARDHYEHLHGSLTNPGYRGLDPNRSIYRRASLFQGKVDYFSSSHERSHILCAYGLSTLQRGTPCYVLVWEGEIGAFYELDGNLNITPLGEVMSQPGNRYGLLYALADPSFGKDGPYPRASDAGKLMALASFSKRTVPTEAERTLLHFLIGGEYRKLSDFPDVERAPHFNSGLEDEEFRNFAGIYSDAIFEVFHRFAKEKMPKRLPLLIAGGCGLNCDWNSKWEETGLFSEVFVPPVANDSGSAIGTAIDAQFHLTGDPKIEWDVYSGKAFRTDGVIDETKYDVREEKLDEIADLLASNFVLGWVSGKYEIGPRALGNRSILAAPFKKEMTVRLNEIKEREQFRPIAPICLMEDARTLFGCVRERPYMLFTHSAETNALAAVTHINGTARIQTVSEVSNCHLHGLLAAFKARTGFGVLCNTSLNFKGKGFINNIVDLDAYASERGLDGFVVAGRTYLLKSSSMYQAYVNSRAI